MALKLNYRARTHAEKLIEAGECEHHSNWNEVKPTQNDTVRFLNTHTLEEYGEWFLAINTNADKESKEYYTMPLGDFSEVHKSALLEAHKIAREEKAQDIEEVIKKLIEMIDHHDHE
jgi:hypothetical protein